MTRALIIVDVQNDFCEGGSLAVTGGNAAAAAIAELVTDPGRPARYDFVVATRDHHIAPGGHFASATGAGPDFETTWPDHCVAGTPGADYHPAIAAITDRLDAEFTKGAHSAAYSGFEATLPTDGTLLGDWLAERGVTEVDVCGIATDYCVKATALHAVAHIAEHAPDGTVRLLEDLVAAVDATTGAAAVQDMEAAGVRVASCDVTVKGAR